MTYYFNAEIKEFSRRTFLPVLESAMRSPVGIIRGRILPIFPNENGEILTCRLDEKKGELFSFADVSTLEEAEKYFQPLFTALEIYGYATASIYDAFGEESKDYSFDDCKETILHPLVSEANQKKKLSLFISEMPLEKTLEVFGRYKERVELTSYESRPYWAYESFEFGLYLLIAATLSSGRDMREIAKDSSFSIAKSLTEELCSYME